MEEMREQESTDRQASRVRSSGTSESRDEHEQQASDSPDELVRRRAYELYLSRDGAEGNELDDWMAAEREVRGERNRSTRSDTDRESRGDPS